MRQCDSIDCHPFNMLIYKDLFTGVELCSDTYPCQVLDGVMICVTGKYITEKTELNSANFGANASEENPDDGGGEDPSAVSGVDVVLANRLVETGFKKKEYLVHIKSYVARVVASLEGKKTKEEIAEIKTALQKNVKNIIVDFADFQFFMGEIQDDATEEGMMIPLRYEKCEKTDKDVPKMYFFKQGLIEEKV